MQDVLIKVLPVHIINSFNLSNKLVGTSYNYFFPEERVMVSEIIII